MSWKNESSAAGSPHCSQTTGSPAVVFVIAHSNSSSNEEARSSSPRKVNRRPGSTNCTSGPISIAPRNSVSGGVTSCTAHVWTAGDRSITCSPFTLRYWFTARTSNSCSSGSPPSPGSTGPTTYGSASDEVQGVHGEPLTAHWKVAPAWSLSKTNSALNSPDGSLGACVMIVSGSPVVIQTNGSVSFGPKPRSLPAGVGSTFGVGIAASIARAHSQCWPEPRCSRNSTAPQSSHVVGAAGGVPLPHEHSNVSTGSSLAKPKVTSGPEFAGSGYVVMYVSGGVVSSTPRII